MRKLKLDRPWLWIIILVVTIYIILTNYFVEYVISREMESILQYPLILLFFLVTYYAMKIVWKQIKKSQQKTNEK